MALALRIDPWDSAYESALQIDEGLEGHAPDVPVRTDAISDLEG